VALLVGLVFALAVGVMCTTTGMDRDRAVYPVIMMVIACIYPLFAVMAGSTPALVSDVLVNVIFAVAAVVSFKSSLWIVAAALTAHGLLDAVHWRLIDNPGVPVFWPAFCGGYDVMAGAYLAWLLWSGRVSNRPRPLALAGGSPAEAR
jgi:hypothetical protein